MGSDNPEPRSNPDRREPDAAERDEWSARTEERERRLVRRQHTADEREGLADQRERTADEREALADQRERTADQREALADERERRLDALEQRLDAHAHEVGVMTQTQVQRTEEAIARSRALLAASSARLDRSEAQLAREHSRAQREDANVGREMASTSPILERPAPRDAAPSWQHDHIEGLRQRFLALSRDLAEAEERIADTFEHLPATNPDMVSRHEVIAESARDVARKVREAAATVEVAWAKAGALDEKPSPPPGSD